MNSLVVAANAVIPLTVVALLGYYARQKNVVSDEALTQFNKVVFNYCLSLTLFKNIAFADVSTAFNIKYMIFAVIAIITIIFVSMAVIRFVPLKNEQKGVIVQGIYRGNIVILGLSICESIYGSGNLGSVPTLIAVTVPVYNIAAVLVLQHYSSEKGDIKSTLIKLTKNPLLRGAFVGAIVLFLHIQVPTVITESINTITKMTTPLALFILGASFKLQSAKENAKILTVVCLLRLVIVPAIGIAIGVALGYSGVELVGLLVLFGAPAAVSSYPMAVQMGMDGDLAAQILLVTTVMVIFSFFGFITAFGALGLL